MKKLIAALLIISMAGGIALAQGESPQIAYRLLSDYVEQKTEKSADKTGAVVTMVVGGLLLLGAGGLWVGDAIYEKQTGVPFINPDLRFGLTLGFGLGGAVALGVGATLHTAKPRNFRVQYSEVFNESDATVREALAAATLKSIADKSRQDRINGTIGNLAVPAIAIGATIGMNYLKGEPILANVDAISISQIWWFVNGVTNLFTPSEEELLYDKYLAAKDALFEFRSVGK
jgi:hypothetical protein